MPEEKKTNTNTPKPTTTPNAEEKPDIVSEVTSKINDSHNVLIALSSDPSVDEMSSAIGLSLYLDKLGKRTTAIYSGSTPNALEFLRPEETFEPTVGSLQDFIVALNKEKADHLRYKLDGDFVKIYITPYRSRIVKDDLEFSYGDYNVDLVLALNVANGVDLDSALREHGRIMHDATIINITTGNPGKLGEIEWTDKNASSIAEMLVKLLYTMGGSTPIEKEEATAFLTGIVAATNRFSNAKTTPETMQLSSKLMESGADQQLISKNITPDVENKFFGLSRTNTLHKESEMPQDDVNDDTKLDIDHTDDADKPVKKTPEKIDPLLADLKAAEASLSKAGAETVPEAGDSPVDINNQSTFETPVESTESEPSTSVEPTIEATEPTIEPVEESEPVESTEPEVATETEEVAETEEATEPEADEEPTASSDLLESPIPSDASETSEASEPPAEPTLEGVQPEKVIQPPADFSASLSASDDTNKYGQMLEDALKSVGISDAPAAPQASMEPNPAAMNAPAVPTNPEINGVPSINYMPMPGEEVLPPPPAPPIAPVGSPAPMSPITPIAPATPTLPTPAPLGAQPAMQDQVYAPQAADPGAFKIPGM